ncbi:MAG: hypothetical protein CMP50_06565 [Flavobacteriales bacterium]|nr:hypothetical protein [Flavobacteriales bacterium]|tara:strand:- start:533 stop:1522 length:990 start_codon:yes stop_codon:yes gene_type:complete
MNKKNRKKKHILLIFFTLVIIFFILQLTFERKQDFFTEKCKIDIYRFEQDFFSIEKDSFDIHFLNVQKKFPAFFSDTSISFNKDIFLNDTLRDVLDSVNLIFQNRIPNIHQLEEGFCNYKDYFPEDNLSIYTFIDKEFDYKTPVVFANDKLFVSLHLFLGSSHTFYNFLPNYIKYAHDTTFLASSCFVTLAGKHIPYPDVSKFLDIILYYSKAYFFAQTMMPDVLDYQLFKCPEEKIEWCYTNEGAIWRHMIERDYLFSTSTDLLDKFVHLAPFSQFGSSSDTDSPGSVGVWLGLQIWKSYAKNNDITLIDILNETNYMKVLNNSGYKP